MLSIQRRKEFSSTRGHLFDKRIATKLTKPPVVRLNSRPVVVAGPRLSPQASCEFDESVSCEAERERIFLGNPPRGLAIAYNKQLRAAPKGKAFNYLTTK